MGHIFRKTPYQRLDRVEWGLSLEGLYRNVSQRVIQTGLYHVPSSNEPVPSVAMIRVRYR